MLGLSVYEIMFQPAFVNDWPCHLSYIVKWTGHSHNYDTYMTYHGTTLRTFPKTNTRLSCCLCLPSTCVLTRVCFLSVTASFAPLT